MTYTHILMKFFCFVRTFVKKDMGHIWKLFSIAALYMFNVEKKGNMNEYAHLFDKAALLSRLL